MGPGKYDSLFGIHAHDIHGNEVILGDLLQGKKCIIVVNVASKCMLSKIQYKDLVATHKKYRDQGLEIIAFPCNQFLE